MYSQVFVASLSSRGLSRGYANKLSFVYCCSHNSGTSLHPSRNILEISARGMQEFTSPGPENGPTSLTGTGRLFCNFLVLRAPGTAVLTRCGGLRSSGERA